MNPRHLLLSLFMLFAFSAKAQYAGNALDFDGANDIVVSATIPSFFSSPTANDFTIEAWVYPRGSLFARIFFAQPSTTNFVSLGTSTGNVIYFYVIANGTTYSVATSTSIAINSWTHVAARWVAASHTTEVFFDGVLQPGGAGGSSSTGTNGLMVLGSRSDGSQYFNGAIDEVRVWGEARTLCEIQSNMNNSIVGTQANLAVNYNFNQGISGGANAGITALSDISGNAYNGTLNNFALTGTTSNWISSSAALNISGNVAGGPVMPALPNISVCNNESIGAIAFTSSIPGATYSWTNNNTAIGLAASGNGDIAAFTATNANPTTVAATIIVTPEANGCTGTPVSFDIQVAPTPTVNAIQDDTLCNGENTAISFSGAVAGTTYTWTNDNTSIGLAASGIGDITSFTAVNTTTTDAVATVIVTPSITTLANFTTTDSFAYTGNLQTFSVPAGVTSVKINAVGASGGNVTSGGLLYGGKGAQMVGTFTVTPGDVLDIVVGGKGNDETYSSGGGGGSGVNNNSLALIVAGGGAGIDFQDPSYPGIHAVVTTTGIDGHNKPGSGGTGGGNGADHAYTPTDISRGGNGWNIGNTGSAGSNGLSTHTAATNGTWGLGGGGGSVGIGWCNCGGGGGGYSGGGSAYINSSGGGGGSYNGGTSQVNVAGTNTGDGYVLVEYFTTTTCEGTPDTFILTVNPTPTIVATGDQSLCNGAGTTAVNFSGAVTGTTYNWVNNTTSIGLAASGSGNIASFNAVNNTSSPVTAAIIVTPTANGCTGTSDTFTITVKPTTAVTAVTDQVLCNGAPTTAVIFTGGIAGTTYAWINDNTSIGLAANGSTDIASFTSTNTGTINDTAIIIVTPTLAGCPGEADTFEIVVKPTPTVNTVSNQSLCNGAATTVITFGGSVAGTTYNWANNTTSIGLAASGSGDIASFTATNTGAANVTGTITVTPTANGCPGTAITPTITVKPTPTVNTVANQSLCNGTATAAITFSGAVAGTVYDWTNSNTSIGLAAGGTGNIASFTATNTTAADVTATITITPTADGCPGTATTSTITVKPTPTVTAVSNQSLCNGAATTAITFTGAVTGTTYNWTNNTTSIGLAASGSGDIASFTATNTGTANVTGTITVTPTAAGCPGTAITPAITVKPTPTVNAVTNQSLCNGSTTAIINFTGAVTGTTCNWTNNNTSIGLAASGSGNIASFTATNTTAVDVTGTITVTPTAAGCPGAAIAPTITVRPTPDVATVANVPICNGASTAAINFSGAVTGTTFAWTNNNTSIGLAASGTGNIASFTATNTGTGPVSATITVTPAASCPGAAKTFTITVNPTPTVNAVTSQVLCNNEPTTAVNFSGAVTGTTFNWSNNTTSIGLAASGSGNIASFTATNTTAAPVTATITITPVASTCPGSTKTFTILVNPTPKVTTVPDKVVCNNTASGDINFSSTTSGTTYTWANDNTSIGLAASGTGNILSFTGTNPGAAPITATISVIPTANGCVGPVKTFVITINPTIVPTISIASSAPANTICIHTRVTFTASVTDEGSNPVYQWKKNGNNVGTNSPIYDDNNLVDGDIITCDLLSSLPCPSSVAITSNAITTNVNMYVYHTIDIFSDKQGDTLCAGEVVNFTSIISNGGSAPVYQWMKNGFNVGADAPAYTDPRIADGDRVTCSLTTNILCPAASTITNSNRIVMHSLSFVNASVVIVGVYTGYTYVFHSQTTNCGTDPSYQWFLNGNAIAGETNDNLTITGLKPTDKIRVQVTPGRRCTNNASANSNILSAAQVTAVENINVIDRLTLAPNPNNGNFMIEGEINGLLQLKDADLVVTNAVGQVVYRSTVDVHNGSIKAELQLKSVLVSGTYHLSILSNGRKYNARFVVVAE